jgi:hypothetical protein
MMDNKNESNSERPRQRRHSMMIIKLEATPVRDQATEIKQLRQAANPSNKGHNTQV